MTRGSFIKSFIALVAATPAIATSIEVKTGLPKTEYKRACYFKLSTELSEDKRKLKYLITKTCREGKIDVSKPFSYLIGFHEDDFIKNLVTCVITQYH